MSANKLADKLMAEKDGAAIMHRLAEEFKWPGIMEPHETATAICFIAKALASLLEWKNGGSTDQ